MRRKWHCHDKRRNHGLQIHYCLGSSRENNGIVDVSQEPGGGRGKTGATDMAGHPRQWTARGDFFICAKSIVVMITGI